MEYDPVLSIRTYLIAINHLKSPYRPVRRLLYWTHEVMDKSHGLGSNLVPYPFCASVSLSVKPHLTGLSWDLM